MKRILVPTDFSEISQNALKTAAQIAKKSNAEIIILHVLELPHQMTDAIIGGVSIPETMLFIKRANELLDKISLQPHLDEIPVTEIVKMDKAVQGILQISKDYDIDLIVMGTHGSSGIQESLIGSVTEKVILKSEIPILVIKEEILNFRAADIVFVADFGKLTKRPFEKFLNFVNFFGSKIHLVTICTPNNFKSTHLIEKEMNEFALVFDLTNFSVNIYNDTNIEKGIVNFSNSINADVIAICIQARVGLNHFFKVHNKELVGRKIKPVLMFEF